MISIVVPCYNETNVLSQLYKRISQAADTWGEAWEVVAVNDGSEDNTLSILKRFHAKDHRWKVVSFSRNFGHQMAVAAGLKFASGDCAVIMDADLQDPPEIISQFLAKWRQGYEVVYAIRKKRKESFLKRLCYSIFYRMLQHISEIDIPLDSGDFCLMDRKVISVLNAMPERNRFIRGLRAWVGFHQVGVPYERHVRAAGEPQYTFRKLLRLALDGILSFSVVPLHFMFILGLIVSVLSFAVVVFTVLQRIFLPFFDKLGLAPVPGFATIVSGIFFLGGVQLICFGLLGEYIGHIYDEVKQRPPWIVEETCGFKTTLE